MNARVISTAIIGLALAGCAASTTNYSAPFDSGKTIETEVVYDQAFEKYWDQYIENLSKSFSS